MMMPKVSLLMSLLLVLLAAIHVRALKAHHYRPRRGRRLQMGTGTKLKKGATSMPSSAPAASVAATATIPSFVEECVAVVTAKSEFVETKKSVIVRYEYEVLVQLQNADVGLASIVSATSTVDEAVQNYLIQDLLLPIGACSRRLTSNGSMHHTRRRRHLQLVPVTAITQGDADTVIANTCTTMTLESLVERCYRVEGTFRIYVQDAQPITGGEAETILQESLTSLERGFLDGLIYLGDGSSILAANYLGQAQIPLEVVLDSSSSGQAVVPEDTSVDTGASDSSTGTTPIATTAPSAGPSAAPTSAPSAAPSTAPSAGPSTAPSAGPSTAPSAAPSTTPSAAPSTAPSAEPSTAPTETPPTTTTTQENQDGDTAETTPATTTTQENPGDDTGTTASFPNTDSVKENQSEGVEQQTSSGVFSVTATIFITLGGILGLVGAAYIGKQYYRRVRLFGRGVDKNFDDSFFDDSLAGQLPDGKPSSPGQTTLNTSSYSANEPGTESFLRDLEGFKLFDTPGKGSNSGSSMNLSGDTEILNLSLVDMALTSHDVARRTID